MTVPLNWYYLIFMYYLFSLVFGCLYCRIDPGEKLVSIQKEISSLLVLYSATPIFGVEYVSQVIVLNLLTVVYIFFKYPPPPTPFKLIFFRQRLDVRGAAGFILSLLFYLNGWKNPPLKHVQFPFFHPNYQKLFNWNSLNQIQHCPNLINLSC